MSYAFIARQLCEIGINTLNRYTIGAIGAIVFNWEVIVCQFPDLESFLLASSVCARPSRSELPSSRPRSHWFCEHRRQRSLCVECGGIGLCVHNRRRRTCRPCMGSGEYPCVFAVPMPLCTYIISPVPTPVPSALIHERVDTGVCVELAAVWQPTASRSVARRRLSRGSFVSCLMRLRSSLEHVWQTCDSTCSDRF